MGLQYDDRQENSQRKKNLKRGDGRLQRRGDTTMANIIFKCPIFKITLQSLKIVKTRNNKFWHGFDNTNSGFRNMISYEMIVGVVLVKALV